MNGDSNMMRWVNGIGWGLFVLSPCAMAWWVFLWPAAVSDAPGHLAVHWGGILTLACFLASLAALLTARASRLRPYQDLLNKRH